MAKKFKGLDPNKVAMVEARVLEERYHCSTEYVVEKQMEFESRCSMKIYMAPAMEMLRVTLRLWVETVIVPKDEEVLCYIQLEFAYFVESLQEWIMKDDDNQWLDPDMQNAIAGVTYSTARGFLISRFQGTPFALFILPMVNPNDLLDDSVRRPRKRKPKP
jgi:hypothetical protein